MNPIPEIPHISHRVHCSIVLRPLKQCVSDIESVWYRGATQSSHSPQILVHTGKSTPPRERFNEPVRSAPDLLNDNKRLPPPPPPPSSLTERDSRSPPFAPLKRPNDEFVWIVASTNEIFPCQSGAYARARTRTSRTLIGGTSVCVHVVICIQPFPSGVEWRCCSLSLFLFNRGHCLWKH